MILSEQAGQQMGWRGHGVGLERWGRSCRLALLTFQCTFKSLGDLVKMYDSDLVGLGWGQKSCGFNMLSVNTATAATAAAAGPGTTL